jgi:hypothetical protein
MPCPNCKRKCGGVSIKCNFCMNEFCVRCRHVEVHNCTKIENKIQKDKDVLESKLRYTVEKQRNMTI